jgi:hypothetical protein
MAFYRKVSFTLASLRKVDGKSFHFILLQVSNWSYRRASMYVV